MWRADLESRGLEYNGLVENSDARTTDQIAQLNAARRGTHPVAVPPKSTAKEPHPFAVGSWPKAVEAKIGGLDQARKAKNLKVFNPKVTQAKVWLTNFMSICALNQLTDRQKVFFLS
jgi:hypothetical protein